MENASRLRKLLEAARRWMGGLGTEAAPDESATETRMESTLDDLNQIVRQKLCDAIETALKSHQLADARRWIDRGMELFPTNPRLIELRAWHALLTGRADLASQWLGELSDPTPRQKLFLQLVRCQAGLRALAHLELNEWSREPDCPQEARVLLAWLDLQAGEIQSAQQVLHRNMKLNPDAETCRLLILLDFSEDMPHAARHAAGLLLHAYSHHPRIAWWLMSMGLMDQAGVSLVPVEMIGQLADELLARPELIPSLAAAIKRSGKRGRIELLRRSIGRIVDRLDDAPPALQALAELCLAAGDEDDARRWIRRGLRINPQSAAFALLLDSLPDDPGADEDHPLVALRRAQQAHPGYPDLRRALILRCRHHGLMDLARQQSELWITEQPNHPLARKTAGEIAA